MSPSLTRRQFIQGLSLLPLAPLLYRQSSALLRPQPRQPAPNTPNVLVVVFDTLSAPHTSLAGYRRQTTPHLQRFAERATVYHAHYAAGSFTTAGTASLLTGAYPWSHRAFNHAGAVTRAYRQENLFAAFAGRGYHRVAYSHNLLANSLLHQFGDHIDEHIAPSDLCLFNGAFADQVFPHDADIASRSFDDLLLQRGQIPGSLFLSLADRVRIRVQKAAAVGPHASAYPRGVPELFKLYFLLEQAIDGIGAALARAHPPFLAYFHLLPPHEPYRPHRDFIGLFDDGWKPEPKEARFFSQQVSERELGRFRRQYDEYLAYADAQFGRLLDHLAQSGRLDDTIVAFTSDHGQLFERGIHGHVTQTLYDPIIRVPLLIASPGQQERQDIYTPTSCVDLLPTLLHATGQDIPAWCEGAILPGFVAGAAEPARSIFALDAKGNRQQAALTQGTVALRKGRYKLCHYFGYERHESDYELFDLTDDPEERQNLYESRRSLAADLQAELTAKLQAVNEPYGGS